MMMMIMVMMTMTVIIIIIVALLLYLLVSVRYVKADCKCKVPSLGLAARYLEQQTNWRYLGRVVVGVSLCPSAFFDLLLNSSPPKY